MVINKYVIDKVLDKLLKDSNSDMSKFFELVKDKYSNEDNYSEILEYAIQYTLALKNGGTLDKYKNFSKIGDMEKWASSFEKLAKDNGIKVDMPKDPKKVQKFLDECRAAGLDYYLYGMTSKNFSDKWDKYRKELKDLWKKLKGDRKEFLHTIIEKYEDSDDFMGIITLLPEFDENKDSNVPSFMKSKYSPEFHGIINPHKKNFSERISEVFNFGSNIYKEAQSKGKTIRAGNRLGVNIYISNNKEVVIFPNSYKVFYYPDTTDLELDSTSSDGNIDNINKVIELDSGNLNKFKSLDELINNALKLDESKGKIIRGK